VDDTLACLKVKDLNIAKWNLLEETQVNNLNLGTQVEPKIVKINKDLDLAIVAQTKQFFKEYYDIFSWSYKDFKGIPPHITQHRIQMVTSIPPTHQTWYRMNPNYTTTVKQDLDKLFVANFIVLVEEATWFSPLVVVPKKDDKLRICVDFRKLNVATKKDPYPLPFMKVVLDMVASHEINFFLDFPATIKSSLLLRINTKLHSLRTRELLCGL
jgi:hypothetical protein